MDDYETRLDQATTDVLEWNVRPRWAAQDHQVDEHGVRALAWQRASTTTRERDNHRCVRCGAHGHCDVHHRKPRGMGGANSAEAFDTANLITLCRPCHDHVERHRTDATAAGYLVPSTAEPSTIPITDHAGHTWHLLGEGIRIPAHRY